MRRPSRRFVSISSPSEGKNEKKSFLIFLALSSSGRKIKKKGRRKSFVAFSRSPSSLHRREEGGSGEERRRVGRLGRFVSALIRRRRESGEGESAVGRRLASSSAASERKKESHEEEKKERVPPCLLGDSSGIIPSHGSLEKKEKKGVKEMRGRFPSTCWLTGHMSTKIAETRRKGKKN